LVLNMFGIGRGDAKPADGDFIIATMNARLQPLDRGEYFEDPLEEILARDKLGSVTGGGTALGEDGEIESCDIEIQVPEASDAVLDAIRTALEALGAPRGSRLTVEGRDAPLPLGQSEGLALYLNGTDLEDSVYESCSADFVYDELTRSLAGIGKVYSVWQGPTETAFYLYGTSFEAMNAAIAGLVDSYPLCQDARIVKIA
jgi:hypothetical protein